MKYHRILLKLSGEALGSNQAGPQKMAVGKIAASSIAKDIAKIVSYGVQVGIVLGGGNWFRGMQGPDIGVSRVTADQVGMLATVMNALIMRDELVRHQLDVRILSAIPIASMTEPFEALKANNYLKKGKVIIFSGGTGHPFVSTDSAASLRALEIQADILLKATSVEGVYSCDPKKNPHAKYYQTISYDQVIRDELKVMDLSAFIQCRDHQLPIRVFNITKPHSLVDIIEGHSIGTLISKDSAVI